MAEPMRDEAGLIVGTQAPTPGTWRVPFGATVIVFVVGLIAGWAISGAESDDDTPPPPRAASVDSRQLASCREAIAAAREGFGYAATMFEEVEVGMDAAIRGEEIARSRITTKDAGRDELLRHRRGPHGSTVPLPTAERRQGA